MGSKREELKEEQGVHFDQVSLALRPWSSREEMNQDEIASALPDIVNRLFALSFPD